MPPAVAADDDTTEEQSCEARGPLPPYRDVEEGVEGEEGEEGGGTSSYVMHPRDFERPAKMTRATALRRWLVRSCDASLALFFIGFAVVGVVLWFWFK